MSRIVRVDMSEQDWKDLTADYEVCVHVRPNLFTARYLVTLVGPRRAGGKILATWTGNDYTRLMRLSHEQTQGLMDEHLQSGVLAEDVGEATPPPEVHLIIPPPTARPGPEPGLSLSPVVTAPRISYRVPVKITRRDAPHRNRLGCWSVGAVRVARDLDVPLVRGDRPVMLLSESDAAGTVRYEMPYSGRDCPHTEWVTGADGLEYLLVHGGEAADAGYATRVTI